jgi:hypothetical protein
MTLTDKEEFNALVQLTAAIIIRSDNNPDVSIPHTLRRERTVNEAHEILKLIAARVSDKHGK